MTPPNEASLTPRPRFTVEDVTRWCLHLSKELKVWTPHEQQWGKEFYPHLEGEQPYYNQRTPEELELIAGMVRVAGWGVSVVEGYEPGDLGGPTGNYHIQVFTPQRAAELATEQERLRKNSRNFKWACYSTLGLIALVCYLEEMF